MIYLIWPDSVQYTASLPTSIWFPRGTRRVDRPTRNIHTEMSVLPESSSPKRTTMGPQERSRPHRRCRPHGRSEIKSLGGTPSFLSLPLLRLRQAAELVPPHGWRARAAARGPASFEIARRHQGK